MLGQYSNPQTSGGSAATTIVYLAIYVVEVIGMWRAFAKAGQPGWAAIIPIYNLYIMLKIAGRPGWWLILFLIPLVNIVIWFVVSIDVSKSFGQGVGFGIGLALLGVIFWPILGFGDSRYVGPAAGGRPMMGAPPPPPPPPAASTW